MDPQKKKTLWLSRETFENRFGCQPRVCPGMQMDLTCSVVTPSLPSQKTAFWPLELHSASLRGRDARSSIWASARDVL